MAVKPKANHIDQDVLLKFLPVRDGELAASHNCLRVTGVDSKDWYTERFNDICGMFETSVVFRVCCESDLIVGNNVDRAVA
jgi:hypothetical protein